MTSTWPAATSIVSQTLQPTDSFSTCRASTSVRYTTVWFYVDRQTPKNNRMCVWPTKRRSVLVAPPACALHACTCPAPRTSIGAVPPDVVARCTAEQSDGQACRSPSRAAPADAELQRRQLSAFVPNPLPTTDQQLIGGNPIKARFVDVLPDPRHPRCLGWRREKDRDRGGKKSNCEKDNCRTNSRLVPEVRCV